MKLAGAQERGGMAISLAEFLLGGPDTSTASPEPANGSAGAGRLDDAERARCLEEISRLLCDFAKEWKVLELAIADLRAELAPNDFSAALAAAGLDAIEGILESDGEGVGAETSAGSRRGVKGAPSPRERANGAAESTPRRPRSAVRPGRPTAPPAPAKPAPAKPAPAKSALARTADAAPRGGQNAARETARAPDEPIPAGESAGSSGKRSEKKNATPSAARDGRRRDERHDREERDATRPRAEQPQVAPAEDRERPRATNEKRDRSARPSPAAREAKSAERGERLKSAHTAHTAHTAHSAHTADSAGSSRPAKRPTAAARDAAGSDERESTRKEQREDGSAATAKRAHGAAGAKRSGEAGTAGNEPREAAVAPAAGSAAGMKHLGPATRARNETAADEKSGPQDAVSVMPWESMPAEHAIEGGLHRKLEEVLALLKSTLDGRAHAPQAPVVSLPSNLSQEIAQQVAGRIRESMIASLPSPPASTAPATAVTATPVAVTERPAEEHRESTLSPRPAPREPKRIPIGDVASLIDQLNGRG